MKKMYWVASMLAAFLLAAGAARAQSVDDKIKALEQELGQLKDQQVELKKEATTQAAAMPTFSYRPGGGLSIAAADRSWSFRFGYEYSMDFLKLEGNDSRREGDFQIFGRRNRPQFTLSTNNGFWEIASELDMDGDETTSKVSLIQRACARVGLQQLNPWLPRLQFGIDCSGAGSRYRSSEMTFELPTLDRNNGFNTGSHTGIGFSWDNLPAFGLPGTQQFNYYWVSQAMGNGDGKADKSNKSDHTLMWNINPLSQLKNKWINGFGFSMFAWFGNIDERANVSSTQSFQLRTQEGPTRLTFFTSPTAGTGLHTYLSPSMQYKVGPYQINFVTGFDKYNEDSGAPSPTGKIKAYMYKIMNDFMLWGPKGFLTGAPGEAGTFGLGYSYERVSADCGVANCNTAGTGFKRNRMLVHEWDMRYWFTPAVSLHFVVKNTDVANTPSAAQVASSCSRNTNAGNPGKSCNITDMALRFYMVY